MSSYSNTKKDSRFLMMKINYETIKPLFYCDELKDAYLSSTVTGGTITGKTVLVTGGTGDIGGAIVHRFLKEGCRVILAARDENKIMASLDSFKGKYPRSYISSIVIDLRETTCGDKLVHAINEHNYTIDILVNNAGVFLPTDRKKVFREVTEEQFNIVWETNYTGTKAISYVIANHMSKNRTLGSIINIASICALYRNFQYTPYGMSKAAIIQLTETLRREYPNLKVHSIAPGSVATKMGDLKIGSNIAKRIGVLNRVAIPEEIAAIVAFMTSDIGRKVSNITIKASACEVL